MEAAVSCKSTGPSGSLSTALNPAASALFTASLSKAMKTKIFSNSSVRMSNKNVVPHIPQPQWSTWATDEIICLGKVPSPNVGGPLSVLQLLKFLNMDYGVSVFGGPLSVMKVPWATLKFKAISYYSCSSTNFVGYSHGAEYIGNCKYKHLLTKVLSSNWWVTPS